MSDELVLKHNDLCPKCQQSFKIGETLALKNGFYYHPMCSGVFRINSVTDHKYISNSCHQSGCHYLLLEEAIKLLKEIVGDHKAENFCGEEPCAWCVEVNQLLDKLK